jgi:tetratricopeptide (TPR) repeat protein
MKFYCLPPPKCLLFYFAFILACMPVSAQERASKPINLDEALQEPVPQDRAMSYYYFALAKWNALAGDNAKALSQMEKALQYNRDSAALHFEMANLLQDNGRIQQAINYAEEASRLDPEYPDPHWLLAMIYYSSYRRSAPNKETLEKAVQELETFRGLDPENGNAYFLLGRVYFELEQPEKAINAYEKFQSLAPDSDDRGYKEIAIYYRQANDYEKALEYLQKALEINPDSDDSRNMLGELLSKLGRSENAVQVYRKLLEKTPNSLIVKRNLALSLIESGENKEAVDLLGEILQVDPGNVDALIHLGRAQIGLMEYQKAIKTLRSIHTNDSRLYVSQQFYLGVALRSNREYSEAVKIFSDLLKSSNFLPEGSQDDRLIFQHNLALCYLAMEDYESAIALYQEMAKNDPDLNYELMNAYRLNRQFDKAIQIGKMEYEKNPGDIRRGILYAQTLADAGKIDDGVSILNGLLKSNPSEVDLYIQLSQIYLQDERYSEAEDILSQAEKNGLKGEQAEKQLKYQLATVLEKQKDYDRLESLLLDLIKSDPEDLNAKFYLFAVYEKQKEYNLAESLLSGMIETNPENMEAKYYLATVYERQKNYKRAEVLFKEVIKEDPQNAGALNYFGYMLADLGIRLNEAIDYVQKALAIEPENGAFLDSLGWAYFKLNDLENAEKYLLQADQRIKDDPVVYDHLGDLYFKTGDFQKARDFWSQSVKIGTEQEDIQKVQKKLDKLQEKLQEKRQAE